MLEICLLWSHSLFNLKHTFCTIIFCQSFFCSQLWYENLLIKLSITKNQLCMHHSSLSWQSHLYTQLLVIHPHLAVSEIAKTHKVQKRCYLLPNHASLPMFTTLWLVSSRKTYPWINQDHRWTFSLGLYFYQHLSSAGDNGMNWYHKNLIISNFRPSALSSIYFWGMSMGSKIKYVIEVK